MIRIPRVGETFAERYRIERSLGEGGFAVVFHAWDEVAQRPVALKVLKPEGPDGYEEHSRRRFDRETRIVASLQAPTTVVLYDRGEKDGLLFAAFERVAGDDLSQVLQREGRLSEPVVRHVVAQVAASLREAHGHGLLHRDLKPENLRIFEYAGDRFRVKVLDFGLARATDDGAPSITATGEIIGTPRYMAPEQLRGVALTPAADVYALGLIAIEMLRGREALHGASWSDQVERVVSSDALGIDAISDVSPTLRALLGRMTHTSAVMRPSAAGVLAALEGRSPAETIAVKPTRPSRTAAIAIIGTLVLLIGAVLARTPRDEPATVVVRPPPLRQHAPEPVPEPEPDLSGAPIAPIEAPKESGGCGSPPPFSGAFARLGTVGTGPLVYVPRDYDAEHRHPVVILVHPLGQRAPVLFEITRFDQVADAERFLVLAPEAPGDDVAGLFAKWSDGERGLAKIERALEDVAAELCIDRDRVFMIGQSEGARMTDLAACEPWVRGIVTSAATPPVGDVAACPEVPIPHMLLAPMHSGHEPFRGGPSCTGKEKQSVADVEKNWRARNGCRDEGRVTFAARGSTCRAYACDVPFEACHLDGGHLWPGSPPRRMEIGCDGTPPDFPSEEQIWRFFSSIEVRGGRGDADAGTDPD